MRSTLIFKNIAEESESSWEDTAGVLKNFITENIGTSVSPEQKDMQISRAHRGGENQNGAQNISGRGPIF